MQATEDSKYYDLLTTQLNSDNLSVATIISHQVHSDEESDSFIELNIEEEIELNIEEEIELNIEEELVHVYNQRRTTHCLMNQIVLVLGLCVLFR